MSPQTTSALPGLIALLVWVGSIGEPTFQPLHAEPSADARVVSPNRQDQTTQEDDRRQVRDLLERRCVACHREGNAKGGLALDSLDGLRRGGAGGPAIEPDDLEASLLLDKITPTAPDQRAEMPKSGPPLTPEETAILRRWILQAAPWPGDSPDQRLAATESEPPAPAAEDWWSLRPLARPEVPEVAEVPATFPIRNPIDAFILQRLQAEGLSPNPSADRTTLLRRLSFDLTGLPPTPEEIDAFVNDPASDDDALETVVDRLLDSPAYGERWARHWLDVVHYADTHGFDKDKPRPHAWPYRDWIIHALNADLPYDQFLRLQLAGDALAPNDPDAIAATGFVVAGPWDFVGQVELREGTVEKEKTRVLDRDDLVTNALSTFASVTVHCARCHNHRFDPIPQVDYYRLQAVFAGVERGDRPWPSRQRAQRLAHLEQRRADLSAQRDQLDQQLFQSLPAEAVEIHARLKVLNSQQADLNTAVESGEVVSRTNGYHSAISPTPNPATPKWVRVLWTPPRRLTEIRLVPARPTDFPDTPGFGFPVRYRVELIQPNGHRLVVADLQDNDQPNPGHDPVVLRCEPTEAVGVEVVASRLRERANDYILALGELQAVDADGRPLVNPDPSANPDAGRVEALDSIESSRWSRDFLIDGFDSRFHLDAEPFTQRVALASERIDLQRQLDQILDQNPNLAQIQRQRDAVAARLDKTVQEITTLSIDYFYGIRSTSPRPIHLLHRGEVEQPRHLVGPGALSALEPLGLPFEFDPNLDDPGRRLALANWLSDPRNVLTWRSIVNRVWHFHFGRGLVATPNDFGRNGATPSHPELLDWLAVCFRDDLNGSLKRLHRWIVTSSTYRQSSQADEARAAIDADNRLLWRAPRSRLDAESIRDAMLLASGALDRTMGGPGFQPFRFQDDHSPTYDHLDPAHALAPQTRRRTIYRFVVRSVPHPWIDCLDGADPNQSTPVRTITTTPLQALALWNDPFTLEQAQLMAQRLEQRHGADALQAALIDATRWTWGRVPTDDQLASLTQHAQRYGLAATIRVLFNTSAFLFVD